MSTLADFYANARVPGRYRDAAPNVAAEVDSGLSGVTIYMAINT